jgi:hypothetical protein
LIAANEKGWINQDIMKVWVEKVWRKRKQSFFNPKSLLIMDSCRAHITDDTKRLVSKYSKLAIIPGGLTKKIQPLDLSVNKSFKSKLRSTWERWMMTGVKDYTESGKIKRVSYEEISRWILESWQAVTVTCVKNGFQKAFGDTSTPEIEDHEESTSENELSDVPEEIINALHSFDCDSDEDFAFHTLFLYL